jgi:hypothetical protein
MQKSCPKQNAKDVLSNAEMVVSKKRSSFLAMAKMLRVKTIKNSGHP